MIHSFSRNEVGLRQKEKGILVSGFFFILLIRLRSDEKGNKSDLTAFFKDTLFSSRKQL